MGTIVSTLAFPNPPREISASVLAQRRDVVWLRTVSGLQVPAVYIMPSTYGTYRHNNNDNIEAKAMNNTTTIRPTILYSHGNAEDLAIILPFLQTVADTTDCPVLGYEYPGYSAAQGTKASERGCYEAIEAAYRYLLVDCAVSHIVVYGRSLGTGPTVHLCAQRRRHGSDNTDHIISGCILQSPLASAIRCVLDTCTATTLYPLDIFCNQSKIHDVTCPVLIMHGMVDTVVPCDHGRALYGALQQRRDHATIDYPPVWIPGRGHNDMPEQVCLKHCRDFVNFVIKKKKNEETNHHVK